MRLCTDEKYNIKLKMEHLSEPTLMLISFLSYIQQHQAKVYS